MADVQQAASGKGGAAKKETKVSTRIDMTPMVDLAFLLITFFMLTTTLEKPQTMELNMPIPAPPQPVAEGMTIILGEDDKVYYFLGAAGKHPHVKVTDFSVNGIRKVLLQQKNANQNFVVLIKAQQEARYKNIVDILDEMSITGTPRYALVALTPEDQKLTTAVNL